MGTLKLNKYKQVNLEIIDLSWWSSRSSLFQL